MQSIDVVFLYEKAVRELDVACAIKYMAKQQYGLCSKIIQQNYSYWSVFQKYQPRVVILPFCYQERSHHLYLTRWRKSIFFNLSWEQLFYPGNKTAKTPRGQFAVKHVLHHAWSDFYADLLRQQGVPEEHIFVNGNPAYALYTEPYCRYFKSRTELATQYGLDPQKKWVFFPENYNWAFYGEAMLQQMINDGQAAKQVYAMREFSCRSFEAVMQWCEALANHENIEVIVRPRPATMIDEFVARVKQIVTALPHSLHINQKETVRDWVLASDVVVSSYSTTLIEAAIAGKGAYMLVPYPLPASLHQDWHGLVTHLTSAQEFLDTCLNVSATIDTRLGDWARATMLTHGDPIQNLVDRLAQICRREISVPAVPSRECVTLPGRLPLPRWLTHELRRWRLMLLLGLPDSLLSLYRNLRGRESSRRVDPEYEVDVASQADIPRRVSRWSEILDGYRVVA